MDLTRIDTSPDLGERVYRQLLNAICEGKLAPGARFTQEELAASLNVSRQPVHQALRLLKNAGFVIDAGRRGLRVAPLDGSALERLYQVRSVLDGLAARLAAQAEERLDPSVIAEGRKAVRDGRVAAMIDADMRYHQAIYLASGNPFIAETAGRHWQHIARAMGATLGEADLRAAIWDEHEAIIEAINDGDAKQAEILARRHCESAGKTLSSRLQSAIAKEESA